MTQNQIPQLVSMILSGNRTDMKLAFGIINAPKKQCKEYRPYNDLNLTIGNYDIDKGQHGFEVSWNEAVINELCSYRTAMRCNNIFKKLGVTPEKVYIGWQKKGSLKSTYVLGYYKDEPIMLAQRQTNSPQAGQFYMYSKYQKSNKGGRLGIGYNKIGIDYNSGYGKHADEATKEEILEFLKIKV